MCSLVTKINDERKLLDRLTLWASLNDTEDRLESQKNIIQSFFDSMTNP